jgi:ABC-2 type transport system ATP-binding protein
MNLYGVDMSKILELKNVTKTLGKRKVVDHVSFDVHTGEIFGFLGPNGAGKTTTIKMIMGLLSVDEGEIFINGISLKKDFEGAMAAVGGIIENPELYDYMTGRQNLKLFGRMSDNIPQAGYEEIIAQVKLLNRIDEKVKKYSLGMRQRLGVAQALLHNPKLLVLDEPTNGLDPAGIRELRNTLKECAEKEGLAVLVSSHQIGRAHV